MSLDSLEYNSIDFLLVLLALFVGDETFLLGGEDITFGGFLLLVELQATEVGIIQSFGNFVVAQVNAGRGADNITLRHATQWAGVQAEGTGDQQEARAQGLQQNNTLALVTAGQQDEDGTGFKVGAYFALVLAEDILSGALLDETLGGVVSLGLLKVDGTFTTVLGTTDFLDLLDVLLQGLDDWTLGTLQTPLSAALVHLALGVTQNTAMEVSVQGMFSNFLARFIGFLSFFDGCHIGKHVYTAQKLW